MFGKAAKKAVETALQGVQEEGFRKSIKETASSVMQRLDEDNVLEELGDDLGRGLLDRRYIVSEPTIIEVEIFKIKIKIRIKALRFNLRRHRRIQDPLDLHDLRPRRLPE